MQFQFHTNEVTVMRLTAVVLSVIFSVSAFAQESSVEDKIKEAMSADIRTEADVARDRNRRPVETLGFFGFEDDMRVLELVPGGGWYTKLLAPVLRENGALYVSIGTSRVSDNLKSQPGFDHIVIAEMLGENSGDDAPAYASSFSFDVNNIDLALTFRNMHNFDEAARMNINAAVFAALKSGGLYGVVDHTRRHMEADTPENGRRADVVQIIKEVQLAGFDLVDYSNLHYRADDELRYEVGRRTVTGNTDRFTLLFRKP